jgi:hypothetical protein
MREDAIRRAGNTVMLPNMESAGRLKRRSTADAPVGGASLPASRWLPQKVRRARRSRPTLCFMGKGCHLLRVLARPRRVVCPPGGGNILSQFSFTRKYFSPPLMAFV